MHHVLVAIRTNVVGIVFFAVLGTSIVNMIRRVLVCTVSCNGAGVCGALPVVWCTLWLEVVRSWQCHDATRCVVALLQHVIGCLHVHQLYNSSSCLLLGPFGEFLV